MSRPIKAGIDYFPLDVIMDEKVELIDAKYGNAGFGVLIKLYQSIYRNGYFIELDDEKLLLLKNRLHVDLDFLTQFLNDCMRWKIFDAYLYEKYQIITSKGIQKRYIEITKRRKEKTFIDDFLLISDGYGNNENIVNVNINSKNVCNNSKNDDIKKQRKEKESKGKENKEKKKKENSTHTGLKSYLEQQVALLPLSYFKNKILDFFDYRKDIRNSPYKTILAVNGLIKDLNGCLDMGLDLNFCIDKAMERSWLTPDPTYFKNNTNVGVKKNAIIKPNFTGNDTRESVWDCPEPAWAKD